MPTEDSGRGWYSAAAASITPVKHKRVYNLSTALQNNLLENITMS